MGIQRNNPHIFLWHLYDQKLKTKFFFKPTDHKFGTRKKMPSKSQAKPNPHSRNTHFSTTF